VAGTYVAGLDRFLAQFGRGDLVMRCRVDQVYAKYQELRDDLVLHGGGQHHYLRDTIFDSGHLQTLADHTITPDGSQIRRGAVQVAEDLVHGVFTRAPFEFGDLRASGAPRVTDDGAVIYERPPNVHRLTESELRAKHSLRRLGFGNAGFAGQL
jgi:hypothetical protein